jgi:acyl-CoA reductase-like NAD-dependent aldehyde dehydrogenase
MIKKQGRQTNSRLGVLKTYKIYIGGKFPRTESGRYYIAQSVGGVKIANVCLSSRKDFREAVVAARNAHKGWASRSAFNRSQVLYRIAEMLEGRKMQFVEEMILQGMTRQAAMKEVGLSVDRLVYYAGWCDKYQQIFSSVNPVASSHFNFSVPEPMGVVALISPEDTALLGLVSVIAPAIAGGNTCISLASESKPLCAVTFGEVLHSSDVPGGVVNILTGKKKELVSHFSNHMDVNAIVYCGDDNNMASQIKSNSVSNLKRAIVKTKANWEKSEWESPYLIADTQEIKTTWHPIGI